MAPKDRSVVPRCVPDELTEVYGPWAHARVAASRTGGRETAVTRRAQAAERRAVRLAGVALTGCVAVVVAVLAAAIALVSFSARLAARLALGRNRPPRCA